ncbi:conjugal transfer protein TraD [Candidatus Tisiphia endosymbiont of Nemotelus uliginosus]|uniref:conjugal transfer protein TraD n=1 Tax=Candidatus Tisiphia endosymbiont of Nemotelus uliginosus TaxID=3077926 RepID=UPI0035C8873C
MQVLKQSHLERKNDAHKKIMLGGLIIKAGLGHFHPHDPATLYGMLLYSKNLLQDPSFVQKFKELGKELMK